MDTPPSRSMTAEVDGAYRRKRSSKQCLGHEKSRSEGWRGAPPRGGGTALVAAAQRPHFLNCHQSDSRPLAGLGAFNAAIGSLDQSLRGADRVSPRHLRLIRQHLDTIIQTHDLLAFFAQLPHRDGVFFHFIPAHGQDVRDGLA